MTKDIVIKSNRLITAIQTLSLSEARLIQLAIIDARETGTGLNTTMPLRLDAARYAKAFGIEWQSAYENLLAAEKNLFNRQFTFISERGNPVKSAWIQQAEYMKGEASIEIVFTLAVVNEITRIDGIDQFFTQYALERTAGLRSIYAIRLYELLIQWRKTGAPPVFDLSSFRLQLGLGINEYQRMGDFKKNVIDLAVAQINEHTDITASYEQHKKGRTITGFSFKFKQKKTDAVAPVAPVANTPKKQPKPTLAWGTSENHLLKELQKKCAGLTKEYVEQLAHKHAQDLSFILNDMFIKHSKTDIFTLELSD